MNSSLKQFAAGSARAAARVFSAGIPNKQKVSRCEGLINRFKRKLEEERRLLRTMKTMLANEIETKNSLDKILRQCVEDVKDEILRKRSENKSGYIARGKKGRRDLLDEYTLTVKER